MWILFVLGWGACSLLTYSASLAYFQQKWPTLAEQDAWKDLCWALWMGLNGPAAVLPVWILTEQFAYGFQWRIAQRGRL